MPAETTLLTPSPVLPEEAGQRLDKWLSARLPDLSRTRIKSLIEQGLVTSAQATIADASIKVKAGQEVIVALPPDQAAEPEPQDIALAVVYEDDDLIVIDKPAGMVVHPAPGSPDQTLVNALLAHCGDSLSGIGGVRRPGIVHRIDKDTSGLLVVAKNDRAHHALSEQFAAHSLERAYKALVWGVPNPPQGDIEGAIGRSPQDRKKMAIVSYGGKHAHTRYRTIRPFASGSISLVECRLSTGRTHQIRVHMTSIGHPLVGDQTYGRSRAAKLKAIPEEGRRLLAGFQRQALHAYLLGFTHPTSGEVVRFESELPNDISDLMRFLETV
jgi:23S rRNA pseudouridine1911/1915/1917 synthase